MPDAEITDALIRPFAGVRLTDSITLDTFFQNRIGQRFIPWFNSTLAGKEAWTGVRLLDTPQNDIAFHQFWNQTGRLFSEGMSPIQFICLMSIISNEVRGDFFPKTERMGTAGHPGMAYLFDRIKGSKRSYNTLQGNRTALQCFNDESYLAAHAGLPLMDRLARTTDTRWSGEIWPSEFPTDPSPVISGFIHQADFMKFRGRGFIQTTGRANYAPLIEFVQSYDGENSTLDFFQHRWSGKSPAQLAFESTNADWDTLFQQTDLIVAAEAIRVHNDRSGHYLTLPQDAQVLNGEAQGSVFFMGLRISGGQTYAATFKQRVAAVLAAL